VLGDLLCSLSNLLNQGLTLDQILTGALIDVNGLLGGLTDLLNGALGNLVNAVLTGIGAAPRGACAILNLALGPLDLTLLGLNVTLDNCNGGPVTVDITGQTGRGKLLGNLLCELLDGNLLNLGATLQGILNQIVGLLTN